MAPLGIVTIVVSAIRVGGPSWLKAAIGRARENLAVAEVDLMSSTSTEVCELWNGHEIVRSLGSAPVREFICFSPAVAGDAQKESEDGMTQDQDETVKAYYANIDKYIRKGERILSVSGYRLTIAESLGADSEPGKAPTAWHPLIYRSPHHVVAREKRGGAPNVTLNLHKQAREEVYAAAVLGVVLQASILVYAGFATYYPTLKFPKEEKNPVASYSFPCMATGTVALVLGLMLCGHVVESSTQEKTTRIAKAYEARHIWLQRKARVGDQVFGSFAVFSDDAQDETVTSQRRINYEPSILDKLILTTPALLFKYINKKTGKSGAKDQDHSALLESKATIGTLISVAGFVVQFVGLRGVHWSVSIFQLGAVLIMTLVRVFIRRVYARPPLCVPLAPGFELDWFAISLMDRDPAPWLKDTNETETDKPEDTCSCDKGWCVMNDSPQGASLHFETVSLPRSRAHEAMVIRKRLGEVAGWRSLVYAEAAALKRAIELTADALLTESPFDHSKHSLIWTIDAKFNGTESQAVRFTLKKVNGSWTADVAELEAALSLWIYSVDQQRRHHEPEDPDEDGETEEWFSVDDPLNSFSLRSVGKHTAQLRQNLHWWMPRNTGSFMQVWPEGAETPAEFDTMSLAMHRPRAVGPDLTLSARHPCEQPSTVQLQRIEMDLSGHKVSRNTVIATNSFGSLESLYAQELFSAFVWAAAKKMEAPVGGGADLQLSDVPEDSSRESFKLSNKVLSTLANSIQNTGLANTETVFALLIPPLSAENKLPAVHQVIELARQEAQPFEGNSNLIEVGRIYLWLYRKMSIFPSDSEVAVKTLALLVQHKYHFDKELKYWETCVGLRDSNMLRKLRSHKSWLDELIAEEEQGNKLAELYECRWREGGFPDGFVEPSGPPWRQKNVLYLPDAPLPAPTFPDSFRFTTTHLLARRTKYHRRWPDHGSVNSPDIFGRTPVHYAATVRVSQIINGLKHRKRRVDVVDLDGMTPLHFACERDDDEMLLVIRSLLQAGADVNARARDGTSPLHCAAECGASGALRILTEAGATVDALDATGKSPLMMAVLRGHKDAADLLRPLASTILRDSHGRDVLHMAALSGDVSLVSAIHAMGRYSRDRKGDTPLNLAAVAGHLDAVCYFMEKLPDAMDEFGPTQGNMTPLHSAVLGGQVDVVRMLIRRFEIDKDIRDGNGWPLIHSAAWAGRVDMMELLIKEFGVDPESTNKLGRTPLLFGIGTGLDLRAVRAMHEELKCDVKTRDNFNSTLLHEAAHSTTDAVAIIRFLVLEHKLDVDARNAGSRTPVFCAVETGLIESVRLLAELGADLHVVDGQGQTPLHRAAELGRSDMMRLLMDEFGLDGTTADASGRTPLQIAGEDGAEGLP